MMSQTINENVRMTQELDLHLITTSNNSFCLKRNSHILTNTVRVCLQGERVTLESGLKKAGVYEQNFTGRVTPSATTTLPVMTFFETSKIWNKTRSSLWKTYSIHEKQENFYHCIQKIPYIVQMFIIRLRNWIILFKLSRLLVRHGRGTLFRVDKLPLTQCLQGR